jgi:YaiO family outer membrane protein
MLKLPLAFLLSSLVLGAVEPLESPAGRLTVGTYADRFSDATGTWKGWLLSADLYRDSHGPWSASVVRNQRPEGTGTTFMVAKEHGFNDVSWVWAGLSAGSGADFIPKFRVSLDSNLGLGGPWGLGLGGAWSRFNEDYSVAMVQAGPSWMGAAWSASARIQQVSDGSGGSDTGYFIDLRWGGDNLRRWHSLRVAGGRGIIDSLQPGGSLSTSTVTVGTGGVNGRGRGGSGSGSGSSYTSSSWSAPNEFLASTTSHFPLTSRLALKAELGWGRREGQFNLWSGSLQAVFTF